ncbi:hypothetical protein GGI25_000673 [Coemansia spiralis]|uniref:Uncharacterized protein n=2 Tax=Coemansia TaxID=4863 RepID=A0A9W8GE57_9FUNG|nr:hypothetical protein EDC05_000628 [Coemansia umbellata]KAJ2623701.1 hypothetical protein GGI26_002148 [Coemansia sp. RSA 1358]KAJ2680381.1 hypothetical protein GGI25_000673 [Coemansia spiralis]
MNRKPASKSSSMLFPMPRTGSEHWRTYWTQQREHGDLHATCPDTTSEAEKLFGISDIAMSYVVCGTESTTSIQHSCNYLTLQKLQNKDWAKTIAQSIPESIEECNWREVLGKLNHALDFDPECAVALYRRAQVYV